MIRRLILIALTTFLFFVSQAQSDMEILQEAQGLAGQEQYDRAIEKIDSGLIRYPDHHDLLTYRVRVLMWDGQYDMAMENIERLLELNPKDIESLDLQLTLFFWHEKWKTLLSEAGKALEIYPEHEPFQMFRARALIGLDEFKKAKTVLSGLNDPLARELEKQLLLKSHQLIRINGSHSRFSTGFSPWTLLSAGYGQTGKHSWDVTATHGQLFDQAGVRFKANAYPSGPGFYAFVEAGYSPATIFPTLELGAELVKAIRTIEVGGGLKFFRFSETGNAYIYKGVAGWYFGENYASYRVYYAKVLENPSATHLVTIRHFIGNRYRYIQLIGRFGSTPTQVNSLQEIQRLNAQAVIASVKYLPKDSQWLFDVGVGYQNETYNDNQKRERFTLQLGLTRLWD